MTDRTQARRWEAIRRDAASRPPTKTDAGARDSVSAAWARTVSHHVDCRRIGVAVAGVVLLLIGAVRGDRANTQEHRELSTRIEKVDRDVKAHREETRAGFESLSKQISELNTNGSEAGDDVEN